MIAPDPEDSLEGELAEMRARTEARRRRARRRLRTESGRPVTLAELVRGLVRKAAVEAVEAKRR